VRDLFLPDKPQGKFALWFSLIFKSDSPPKLKIYFNPQVRGPELANALVAEGLGRLGLRDAFDAVIEHAQTRGDLDQFTFFALDIDNGPRSRLKMYVAHEDAVAADAERAASLVPGVDPMRIREFCSIIGGGERRFEHRPLLSSYSFVGGDTNLPSNYSLYIPIRDYVPDDEVARERTLSVMSRYGIDGNELDRSIAALSDRSLNAGVGLIAHVSIRLGTLGSGITTYLSSEAYDVLPPRHRSTLSSV